ncbi:MAG: hypothetical protein EPN76_05615 [Burkholderiaceae bacterium]|nr:MAG: hypothetical protein EPN76_05615 [Burkholderiaceae bacterium]TAM07582.1 MAG: hypothetical protein EPN67_03665 [Pusillimonas sp.]
MAIDLPDVYFGSPSEEPADWRNFDDPDPDDEELEVTDPLVVAVLGFDPKEFSKETADDVSHEAGATKSKSIE